VSCAAGIPRFRLLDPLVGWDEITPDGTKGLMELPDDGGLVLGLKNPGAVDPNAVSPYLPPARLARGCDPCQWFLVTPAPSRLLVHGPCTGGDCSPPWVPVDDEPCSMNQLVDAVAIAVWRHFVAVSDADTLWIFGADGRRIMAAVPLHRPGPVAFTPHGEIVVATRRGIVRVALDGRILGVLPAPPPPHVVRIGVGRDCRVWVASEPRRGELLLWSAAFDDNTFRPETADVLAKAFPSLGIVVEGRRGFCIGADESSLCCYSWYGRCLDGDVESLPGPARETLGQLLTLAIDSGIARCVWHRVRVDAVIPVGTTLQISVATTEDPNDPPQGTSAGEWAPFPAGVPHPNDWQNTEPGETDFLIRRLSGRYLYVRARLTGDGKATPILRRIRLDFPRLTSLDFLPLVYREEPEAEEFTERFLSIFDAVVEDADRLIERSPALLDPAGIPAEVLPWLGTFFDVVMERKWGVEQRRAILQAVPDLYMLRGTVEGLRRVIDAVFGVAAHIEELGPTRNWGATGRTSVVGAVRIFSRSAARLRLGTSRIGRTPLRSYGNPDRDPDSVHAFRIRVSAPSAGKYGAVDVAELRRLVEAQKPAHVMASIVRTSELPIVGARVSVEIDTILGSLQKPILGSSGNVRLRRASILWHGPYGRQPAMRLGRSLAVGLNTIME
jgi:phage tail-like protein